MTKFLTLSPILGATYLHKEVLVGEVRRWTMSALENLGDGHRALYRLFATWPFRWFLSFLGLMISWTKALRLAPSSFDLEVC